MDPQRRYLSFEDLLRDMMKGVGMRRGVRRIIDLRNDLIHSSTSALPVKSQWLRYETAMRLSQEYLLRLLGYRGYYRAYGGPVRHLS